MFMKMVNKFLQFNIFIIYIMPLRRTTTRQRAAYLGSCTNQIGLNMSGGSNGVGRKGYLARYIGSRVQQNQKYCGPVMYQGQIWRTNKKPCVKKVPRGESFNSGVGHINAPRFLCNKNCKTDTQQTKYHSPIENGDTELLNDNVFVPIPDKMLKQIVSQWFGGGVHKDDIVKKYGSIENWDTSEVTDMSYLFHKRTKFDAGIGNWNTEKVTNMENMFAGATLFNQSIGQWQTENVTTMDSMFWQAESFNQPIGQWQTENVTTMGWMFYEATSFNQPIGQWKTENVTGMKEMFYNATSFNQHLGGWEMTNSAYLPTMNNIFTGSGLAVDTNSVRRTINNDTGATKIFENPTFSTWEGFWWTPIPKIVSNTPDPTDRSGGIRKQVDLWIAADDPGSIEKVYGPITYWDTRLVTNMSYLLNGKTGFKVDIGGWDTSNVTTMKAMFYNAKEFNRDVSKWNTDNVLDMHQMFFGASSFDQKINYNCNGMGGWSNKKVTDYGQMFANATKFWQSIKEWNVAREAVEVANYMFSITDVDVNGNAIGGWKCGTYPCDTVPFELLVNAQQFTFGCKAVDGCF
jgi:surface protein